MKTVFSILHYQAIEVTKKSVSSLMKLNYEDMEIVIVDNASPNGSGETLSKIYKEYNNIHVLQNHENEGFAKGNNKGFLFAKATLKPEIIIVMNNDVLIEDNEFVNKLVKYEQSAPNIHILAPDIITPNGEHQNPFRISPLTTEKIIRDLAYNLLMTVLYKIPILNKQLVRLLEVRASKKELDSDWQNKREEVVPHGAVIIYKKKYIEKEDIAFVPITFLFGEEDILFKYAKNKSYKINYEPSLKVLHLEDVSIREVTKTELKRRQFLTKEKVKSLFTMLKFHFKKSL